MRDPRLRALWGFVWGLALFLAVARLLKLGLGSTNAASPVISQIVLKTALIVVALFGWMVLRWPFSEMGWRRADWWNRAYLPWFLVAAAAMMGGSVAAILLGVRHPIASQMSFLQLVVVVWLLSSCSEEIYVRGLVQSWVAGGDGAKGTDSVFDPAWVAGDDGAKGTNSVFDPAIVSSALLFAALHVSLMWSPMGVKGGLTIVLSTLGVGWACAILRARSGSLLPAIACHIVGNVAGVPGGILGMILYRLIYGRLPEILTSG
jgi:Type II CAAX prenyl endopeptidase Rce1-like